MSMSSSMWHTSLTTSTDIGLQHIGQYIEDYIDLVENVPNDVARLVSLFHESNTTYQSYLKEAEEALEIVLMPRIKPSDLSKPSLEDQENGQVDKNVKSEIPSSAPSLPSSSPDVLLLKPPSDTKRRKAVVALKRALVSLQVVADEKLEISQRILDTFDVKARQLDADFRAINATSGIQIPGLATSSRYGSHHYTLNDQEATHSARRNLNVNGTSNIIPNNNNSNNFATQNASDSNNGQSSSDGAERDTNTPSQSNTKQSLSNGNGTSVNLTSNSGTSLSGKDGNVASTGGNKRQSSRRNTTSPRVIPTNAASDESAILSGSASAKRIGSSGAGGKRSTAGGKTSTRADKKPKGSAGASSSGLARPYSPVYTYDDSVDPDEPTYCLCKQISFGEMICCDNDVCTIEWFHFSCVNLSNKPKGKWYCPHCRGDRANVQRK